MNRFYIKYRRDDYSQIWESKTRNPRRGNDKSNQSQWIQRESVKDLIKGSLRVAISGMAIPL